MGKAALFILMAFRVCGQSSAWEQPALDSISPVVIHIDKSTVLNHFYINGELVALELLQTGDLANRTSTTWYFNGDIVKSAMKKECRTDDTQILDLAMYTEAHRRSDGTVDYSELPCNCVTLKVDFQSPRMLRTIDGTDIFPPAAEYNTERRHLYNAYFDLVKDVSLND